MDRLRTLNPNVIISADVGKLGDKTDEYFKRFNVVIATCSKTDELVSLTEERG